MQKLDCFLPANIDNAQLALAELYATWSRLALIRLQSIVRRMPECLEMLGVTAEQFASFPHLVAINEAKALLTELRDTGGWYPQCRLMEHLVTYKISPGDLGITRAELDLTVEEHERLVAAAA